MAISVRNLRRVINRSRILEIIRTVGMISRINLAQVTGLSQAFITGITADLIKEGLIIEKQSGEYKGGRRPVLLAVNANGVFAVGVDISMNKISVVIVNFKGTVVASKVELLIPVYHEVSDITDKIVNTIQACIWENNFSREQIKGVGLGVTGLVDSETGLIRFMPNYGWGNVNLKDPVQSKLNHPCYIDNSSNTLALAEQWFGDGKGIDNFLTISIETGIGLGAVVNSRIYRGEKGASGEFGHITIDPNGPQCRCGKKGCIEAFAGNIAIIREARQAALENRWNFSDPEKITINDVINASKGDSEAIRSILANAGRVLGIGISYLLALFDPKKIIINGQLTQAGDLIFNEIQSALDQYVSPKFGRRTVEFVMQKWTELDWARGAGVMVLQELYKSPVGTLDTYSDFTNT